MVTLDEFRVLIMGGGTCGLAIAQGLQKVRGLGETQREIDA